MVEQMVINVNGIVVEFKRAAQRNDQRGIARAIARFKDAVPTELIDACAEEKRKKEEEVKERKENIFTRIALAVRDDVRDEDDRQVIEDMETLDGSYYSELRERVVTIADKEEPVRNRVNAIRKAMEVDRPVEWVGMMSMPAMTIKGIILEHILNEIIKDGTETKTMKKTAQKALDRIAANFKR